MALSFRKVTDDLISKVTLMELAEQIGCSLATIDQARLSEEAKARRSPPPGWQKAVLKLAEARVRHFQKVAEAMRAS